MGTVGWFAGALIANELILAARVGAADTTGRDLHLIAIPGIVTLATAAVRLFETNTPGWHAEWRAFTLFSAAFGYLWILS